MKLNINTEDRLASQGPSSCKLVRMRASSYKEDVAGLRAKLLDARSPSEKEAAIMGKTLSEAAITEQDYVSTDPSPCDSPSLVN